MHVSYNFIYAYILHSCHNFPKVAYNLSYVFQIYTSMRCVSLGLLDHHMGILDHHKRDFTYEN